MPGGHDDPLLRADGQQTGRCHSACGSIETRVLGTGPVCPAAVRDPGTRGQPGATGSPGGRNSPCSGSPTLPAAAGRRVDCCCSAIQPRGYLYCRRRPCTARRRRRRTSVVLASSRATRDGEGADPCGDLLVCDMLVRPALPDELAKRVGPLGCYLAERHPPETCQRWQVRQYPVWVPLSGSLYIKRYSNSRQR